MKCALYDKDLSEKDLETHIRNIHEGHKLATRIYLFYRKRIEELKQTVDMSHGPGG